MRRGLTVVACLWALMYVALYIAITRADNGPAWWYVGLVVVAVLVAATTLTGARPRVPLAIATGLFGVAILLGALSIGPLLVPAAVLTGIGAVRGPPAEPDDAERDATLGD